MRVPYRHLCYKIQKWNARNRENATELHDFGVQQNLYCHFNFICNFIARGGPRVFCRTAHFLKATPVGLC